MTNPNPAPSATRQRPSWPTIRRTVGALAALAVLVVGVVLVYQLATNPQEQANLLGLVLVLAVVATVLVTIDNRLFGGLFFRAIHTVLGLFFKSSGKKKKRH